MQKVIAIDGPSASGKGTVAAKVAQILGWKYLDSGALYRLTALYAQNQNIEWKKENESLLAMLAENLPVTFIKSKIYLDQEDVSDIIRHEHIGMGASIIAALPLVRMALLTLQRAFLTEQGLVADGRDMASVVFPQAQLKIFLTASAQVRAQRRAKQLNIDIQGNEFKKILRNIEARDAADFNRSNAPLRQQCDALLLDTSNLNIEQSVKKVLDWYYKN